MCSACLNTGSGASSHVRLMASLMHNGLPCFLLIYSLLVERKKQPYKHSKKKMKEIKMQRWGRPSSTRVPERKSLCVHDWWLDEWMDWYRIMTEKVWHDTAIWFTFAGQISRWVSPHFSIPVEASSSTLKFLNDSSIQHHPVPLHDQAQISMLFSSSVCGWRGLKMELIATASKKKIYWFFSFIIDLFCKKCFAQEKVVVTGDPWANVWLYVCVCVRAPARTCTVKHQYISYDSVIRKI